MWVSIGPDSRVTVSLVPGPASDRVPPSSAGSQHDLGGIDAAREVQQGLRNAVADDRVIATAERLDQPTLRAERRDARRRRARRRWRCAPPSNSPPPLRVAIRAARRISVSPSGPPVSPTTIRSRVSQVPVMPCCSRYRCIPSSTWSASQSSASSRSAVRLPGSEVVAEGGVDPLRWIDVAVGHPAPQGLRCHVDQFDLVCGPDDRVGDGLSLRRPGDLLDDVAQ